MNIEEIIAQAERDLGIQVVSNDEISGQTVQTEEVVNEELHNDGAFSVAAESTNSSSPTPIEEAIAALESSPTDSTYSDGEEEDGEEEEEEEEEEEGETREVEVGATIEETLNSVLDEIILTPTSTEVSAPSASYKESVSRFRGAPWFEIVQQQYVLLAGLGGIGSWTSLLLSRMRPRVMKLYDNDTVEAANMSGQLYGADQLEQKKTLASAIIADKFSGYKDFFTCEDLYTESSDATDVMICGFDSIDARRTFFKSWVAHVQRKPKEQRANCFFMDGRLAAEAFQILCITGDDYKAIELYQKEWLFDAKDAEQTICSYKQTSYCASMIASVMVNLFVNFCTNLGDPDFPRDLPFVTSYDADLMLFRKEYSYDPIR